MQMSLVSMRFIQFHVVLVQGQQKNVPKKNTIRGKFFYLLNLAIAAVLTFSLPSSSSLPKPLMFIDVCKLLGIRMCF